MWSSLPKLLILTLALLFPSSTPPIATKDTDLLSPCSIVSPTVVVIPCRYFDELPIHLPPVDVECNDLTRGFGDGDTNRCTNVV